jgi:uncharacterized repeat protein (TIGR04052 family)
LNKSLLRLGAGAATLSVLTFAAACGEDDPITPAGPIDVAIAFDAAVNGTAFACGQSYAGVGTGGTMITPVDFRFYVHDVALIDANGATVPVELDQDGQWQRENLALLDFEDGSGPCVNGTAAVNTTVRGTAPAGEYTGVQFVLGVPESLNHADQTTATAPLDLTALFWSWNAGYKFARIDHTSDAQPEGWFVHLGSTGCSPSGDPTVPATSCANQHRPTVRFNTFDQDLNEIVADYGAILAGVDVSVNAGPRGCMSFPGDPQCPTVMNAFGLDYEGNVSTGQTFFSVR